MSLNIHVITDQCYRKNHKLLLQLSTSIHHSHSHCRSPTSLLFILTAATRGVFIPLSRTCTCAAYALEQLTSQRAAARASWADDVMTS